MDGSDGCNARTLPYCRSRVEPKHSMQNLNLVLTFLGGLLERCATIVDASNLIG